MYEQQMETILERLDALVGELRPESGTRCRS